MVSLGPAPKVRTPVNVEDAPVAGSVSEIFCTLSAMGGVVATNSPGEIESSVAEVLTDAVLSTVMVIPVLNPYPVSRIGMPPRALTRFGVTESPYSTRA